jgi:hypothetical protein
MIVWNRKKMLLPLSLLILVCCSSFAWAIEWRLTLSPFLGVMPAAENGHFTSSTWEAFNPDRGYVFVTVMESNEKSNKAPLTGGGELGLEAWLSTHWGLSLRVGLAPITLVSRNLYRLDYMWYDGDTGLEKRDNEQPANMNRYWLDLSLNYRLILGNRWAAIIGAGVGLHHLEGRIDQDFGWAATIIADQYYMDFFLLPLAAEFKHSFVAGQLGLSLEYRLTRTLTARFGLSGWLAEEIRVPYLLAEDGPFSGLLGHIELINANGLLNAEQLHRYALNPSTLRFIVGISLWL